MPERIQRKRTKGWRAPEGAVYVGRGSQWGNPFRVGENKVMLRSDGARVFFYSETPEAAVGHYREIYANSAAQKRVREELAGKDLMCWCPLDQPCHADVLLEIANEATW